MFSRLIEIRFIDRQTTGYRIGYFGEILPNLPEKIGSASPLIDALTRPAGKTPQDGPLLKQPFATDSCQLKLVSDD